MEKLQEISFDEKEHRYYDLEGNNYISCTTLIGKYTDTFDGYYWGMYTALKDKGYKVKPDYEKGIIIVNNHKYKIKDLHKDTLFTAWYEETLAKWKGITIEACMRGNRIHNELEDNINQSKGDYKGNTNRNITSTGEKVLKTIHDLDKTNFKDKYPEVYKRLYGYIERGFSIFAEKKVHLSEYKVAGMIDVPMFIDKHFCILDWKSNKDTLHTTSGYYKKEKIGGVWVKTNNWVSTDDKLKYPLNNIPASKFHTYALQLSLYAYILEQWGYTLLENGLEIIHFPVGDSPRLLKIPYLKDEIKILLNHYKQNTLLK